MAEFRDCGLHLGVFDELAEPEHVLPARAGAGRDPAFPREIYARTKRELRAATAAQLRAAAAEDPLLEM